MGSLKGTALWLVVEGTCTLLPDAEVLAVAKWATMKKNGQAAKHLEQYITGAGDLAVDLKKVLKEDPKLEKFIATEIVAALGKGKKKGNVAVAQSRYGNKDWWFAIGSMNVTWKMKKKGVALLSFKNKYQWHPNEKRISQCVHEAAEGLKVKAKAKDYMMYDRGSELDLKKATAGWGSSKPPPEIFEIY